MKIYKNLKKNLKKSVIAIGNFDGVHLGHQKVLKEARLKAKKNNLNFGVVSFEPVPVMFFNKNIKNHRINNYDQKVEYLKKISPNFLRIIKFNKKFSNYEPKKFIQKIIYNNLNAKFVFVSKNFRFGKGRKGDIYTLKKFEKYFNYKTIISSPLKKDKKILSSTIIRKKISLGKVKEVSNLLGRPWCIKGLVIKGEQRGRKIGFPTCNINLKEYVIPRLGVYSVKIKIGKKLKKGIANIGYRPTFSGKSILLEVNIFGINSNLYKRMIIVNFIKFIRKEKKFKNINELRSQISKDIKKAKK